MDFDIIVKMVKVCVLLILTIAEVLSGDKPDKPEF